MESTNKSNNSCISQRRSLLVVCYILILLIGILFINQESILDKLSVSSIKKTVENRKNIAILVIVDSPGTESLYKTARDSLICYAKMHNYSLEVIYTSNNVEFSKTCPHTDVGLKFQRYIKHMNSYLSFMNCYGFGGRAGDHGAWFEMG
jgi:hypothetical protein